MTKPVLLQLDNICAGYGEIDVLQDISIKLLEGELISVVGPNGAGKTT
ncbi:MAG: ATP-binding cassette domain-containing protein, partial [Gammaproteobacteria bacterium]|nr:ATP-binding cassette domain-containing protein [Gammaproteobacteria bacterium]